MEKKTKYRLSGVVAGLTNGIFGGGGGIPLLVLLTKWAGVEEKKAFATCVAVIFPMCAVSAALWYWRAELSLTAALPYLLGGFAGGLVGGRLFKKVPGLWLRRIFALFLLYGASLQQSYLELLEEKNRRIGEMAAQLKRYRVTNVEVDDISREVGAMTTNVRAISLMKGITFDVSGAPLDTTLVCVVTPKVASDSIDRTTLANWLRIRTKVANVKLFVEP